MPVELNWANLRSINGSQQKGFEKFCVQLARQERVEDGSVFIPVGDPDAGVECYWLYTDGKEWGWQAKFFTTAPQDQQWNQVTRSVERALESHPELKKYTICMPIDLPDAHIRSQLSCREKWERNKARWEKTAADKGMEVEFEYWGETDIVARLSSDENKGRTYFWFDCDLVFSGEWLKRRLEENIENVGPRYTRELNVDVPITGLFEELGRTSDFFSKIQSFVFEIKKAFKWVDEKHGDVIFREEYKTISRIIDELIQFFEGITTPEIKRIPWENILIIIKELADATTDARAKIEETTAKETTGKKPASLKGVVDYRYSVSNINNLSHKTWAMLRYIEEGSAELANQKGLLVVGTAGTGKTHLFCDIAENRIAKGLPTILLLGEHFTGEEPWSQIINQLGVACDSKDEFLGALSAAAESVTARALILIDALNEGHGKTLWNNYLPGFLNTISRYPWIGVAVSVRSSYKPLIIRRDLTLDKLYVVEHYGFSGLEYEALNTFFDYYNIELPSVPLLSPEFRNPLFLGLFCQGIHNIGLKRMPKGIKGIKAIFDFYLEAINEKLYRPEYLNYDKDSNLVQKTVESIAAVMAEKKQTWIYKDEAKVSIDILLPRNGYENTLFRHLLTENVITEDIHWNGTGEPIEIIRFPYERFSDHYITKYLLDKYLGGENPEIIFREGGPLNYLVQDERTCYYNQGLISALSIQIPEMTGKEFYELVPLCSGFSPFKEAFIESLVWRDYGAFSESTSEYINEYILSDVRYLEPLLEALLTVSIEKEHPHNARSLHNFLMQSAMAERDSWWSIFLHSSYADEKAINRIIDWALSKNAKSSKVESETVLLTGFALSWFLTSSNRFLRDRATKALVNIFEKRITLLRSFIPEFLTVNDVYILERLFAVAYGCALRTTKYNDVKDLAIDVYEWVFEKGSPPVHLLLRDYARGIIELGLRLGFDLDIPLEKVRPPYRSEWPENIPSEKELEAYGEKENGTPGEYWAQIEIYNSVMGFGDFARYILGTNSGSFNWFNIRLTAPNKRTYSEITRDFERSLTERQLISYKRFEEAKNNIEMYRRLGDTEKEELFGRLFTEVELDAALALIKNRFIKKLGKKKKAIFEEYVIPYIEDRRKWDRMYDFDLGLAQRFILQRVFEMGWSVEKFGVFDRNMKSLGYSRTGGKPERIGKKYQWIAFFEFLARVADNFVYRENSYTDMKGEYEGPWQIYRRDIDPSCLITATNDEAFEPDRISWWFPISFENWEPETDAQIWLKREDDLPSILDLINVRDASSGIEWLNFDGFFKWAESETPYGLDEKHSRREIWYMVRSYIIKKTSAEAFLEWGKRQSYMGDWMPRPTELIQVYLGEFDRSLAHDYYLNPYYGYEGWTKETRHIILPDEVLNSAEYYMRETGVYDCSVDDTIIITLPSKWLADNLKIRPCGVEGVFVSDKNEIVVFDPSVREPGPRSLLINKDYLEAWVSKNDYCIFWTILGEKREIGDRAHFDYKGNLEINGAFVLIDGVVKGGHSAEFKPAPDK